MSTNHQKRFWLLFVAMLLTAGGYGASFLFTEYFRGLGGNEIDVGWVLAGAALGTLGGVPAVGFLAVRWGAATLCGLASLVVALGFGSLALIDQISFYHVFVGFFVGMGWGAFYLAAPMSLSERISDSERTYWFMWLNAFQMAGIGGGPLVTGILVNNMGVNAKSVFWAVAAACVVASLAAFAFRSLLSPVKPAAAQPINWIASIIPLGRTTAIYPIAMVLLGACVFTSILNFQSSFARVAGYNPSLFYAVYTATVVLARVGLARYITKVDPNVATVNLLACMALGVLVAFLQSYSVVFYALSAVLLGVGYGLVYSVIQTLLVNDAPAEHRAAALTWFVLSYFVGVFGFPIIGGSLIVQFGTPSLLLSLLGIIGLEFAIALQWMRIRRRVSSVPVWTS